MDRLYIDDSSVAARLPRASTMDSIAANPTFHYRHTAVGKSLWDRFWNMVNAFLGKIFGGLFKVNGSVWYFIIAVIIIVLVYRFFRSDIVRLFSKKARRKITVHDITENVHELDFDNLIKKNINEGHYRYAIRLYYLKALKLLDSKGIINWQPQFTNREYLLAVRNSALYPEFSGVTDIFNYVWYGEFSIDEKLFRQVENEFVNFNRKIGG